MWLLIKKHKKRICKSIHAFIYFLLIYSLNCLGFIKISCCNHKLFEGCGDSKGGNGVKCYSHWLFSCLYNPPAYLNSNSNVKLNSFNLKVTSYFIWSLKYLNNFFFLSYYVDLSIKREFFSFLLSLPLRISPVLC